MKTRYSASQDEEHNMFPVINSPEGSTNFDTGDVPTASDILRMSDSSYILLTEF